MGNMLLLNHENFEKVRASEGVKDIALEIWEINLFLLKNSEKIHTCVLICMLNNFLMDAKALSCNMAEIQRTL